MSLKSTNGLLLLSTALLCMALTPGYINAQTIKPVSTSIKPTVPSNIKLNTNKSSPETIKLSPEEVESRLNQATEETETINSPVLTSTYDDDCSQEHQDFNDELMHHLRITTESNAFDQCVRTSVENSYQRCIGDPFYSSPMDKQIQKVLEVSRSKNNTNVSCTGGGGLASARLGEYAHTNDENFSWSDWLSRANKNLDNPICKSNQTSKTHNCRSAKYPWPYSQGSEIILHEVLHTHGYTHGANSQTAAIKACGYAGSSSWNFQQNTMPYIVDQCVSKVIKQSSNTCGEIRNCPFPNQLNIVKNIDGNSCECISDPARIGKITVSRGATFSNGFYTIQQKNKGKFLDAYQTAKDDYNTVTRKNQNDDSQKWEFTGLGGVFLMKQKSKGLYIGRSNYSEIDYPVLTQSSAAEKWVIIANKDKSSFTLQNLRNFQFLDAYQDSKGHSVVTRTAQNNTTQEWTMSFIESDNYESYKIQQVSSKRFLDAYDGTPPYSLVTRPSQNNDTQTWELIHVGDVYNIKQKSSNRFLDAYETQNKDYSVVTRSAQNNDSQKWVVLNSGSGAYTIQQLSTGRFFDAYESNEKGRDFSVVTRDEQKNDKTQQWVFTRAE